ncbi:hypothetical protein ACHAPJ_008189 [Fusarium lateritium]
MTDTEQGAERQYQQDRIDLLKWICPHDSTLDQQTFLARKQPGTAEWLLESKEYKGWKAAKGQTLFCPGIRGAGKTVLTSIVIEDLESHFRHNPGVGIVYAYLNYRQEANQSVSQVLASLLRHLEAGQAVIHDHIQKIYDMRTGPVLDLKLNTIYEAIHTVGKYYRKVFIVVDALDECPETDGRRSELLKAITRLQVDISANLLCTSRHIPDIEAYFTKSTLVEVRATEHDIQVYLDSHLDCLPGFVGRDHRLQDEVKEAIVRAVDGRMLLAHFHLESLAYKQSPKALRAALIALPSGSNAYHQVYQDTMHRVEAQHPDRAELAKHALMWIVYTKVPLTTLQLREALVVEKNDQDIDRDNRPDIEDIVAACGGLVTVNKATDTVQLSHHTVQEFFEQTQGTQLPDANARIGRICLTYLSFLSFHEGPSETYSEFENRLEKYPLYGYAARYWGVHAHHMPPSKVLAFFKQDYAFQASHQAFLVMGGTPSQFIDKYKKLQRPTTGLHMCACFGLLDAMRELIQTETVDLQDGFGMTPLAVAARHGQFASMQLLLGHGADANSNSADKFGKDAGTPLHWAAKGGQEDCVRLLLGKVYPDSAHGRSGAPLTWAAKAGHTNIVKLFLGIPGVDLSSQDKHDCLFDAILNNRRELVSLLVSRLDLDLNFRHQSRIGMYSHLEYAIMFNLLEIFEILMESGKGDLTSKGTDGWTLLHFCDLYESTDIKNMLLRKGDIDVDAMTRGFCELAIDTGREPAEFIKDMGNALHQREAQSKWEEIYGRRNDN